MHRAGPGGHGQSGPGSGSHSDWTIRERLVLSSSVLNSGDQNWVSVSRTVKPLLEGNRPPDKFSQKNCAMEYSDMLEKVAPLKRKRSTEMGTGETPGEQIVRRLTFERIEELKKSIKAQHALYKKLKQEAKLIAEGKLDHKLEQMWQEIQAEKRAVARALGLPVESPTPPATASTTVTTSVESKQQETESTKSNTQPVAVAALKPGNQQKRPESNEKQKTEPQQVSEALPSGVSPGKETDRDKSDISTRTDNAMTSASHSTDGQTGLTTQKPEKTSKETNIETKTSTPSNQSEGCPAKPTESSVTKPTQLTDDLKDEQANDPMETDDGNETVVDDGSTIEDDDPRRDSETDATISPEELSGEEATGDVVEEERKETESKEEMVAEREGETKKKETEEKTRNQVEELVDMKEEEEETKKSEEVETKCEETEERKDQTEQKPSKDESQITDSQVQKQETVAQQETEADKELIPVHPVDKQETEQSETVPVSVVPTQLISTPVTVTIHQGTSDLDQPSVVTKPEPSLSSELLSPKPIQTAISTITRPLILRPIHKTVVPPVSTPTASVLSNSLTPLPHHTAGFQVLPPVETKEQTSAPSVPPSLGVLHSSSARASHIQPVAVSSESNRPETVSCHSQVSVEGTDRSPVEGKDGKPALPPEPEPSEEGKEIMTVTTVTVESIKDEDKPSKPEDDTFNSSRPLEVRRTRRSFEQSKRRFSEQCESLSSKTEPTERPKTAGYKRIRASSMRTRSRGQESDSPIDEDSRESFPDFESQAPRPVDSEEKRATHSLSPADTTTQTGSVVEGGDQLRGDEGTATVGEVEEDLETSRLPEGVETVEEEESTVEDEDVYIASCVPSTLSSAPSSPPTSVGHMDAETTPGAWKTWKKSIMHVWRKIAEHRYANLFLRAVSEKEAPGYYDVVRRPTDLATIKAKLESGVLRTTEEFQHRVLLMFQNALMYNASDHEVYRMAEVMRADFLEHIEEFVSLQVHVNSQPDRKSLRGVSPALRSKRSDREEVVAAVRQSLQEEMEGKRTRLSSADSAELPSAKRRKVRGDD